MQYNSEMAVIAERPDKAFSALSFIHNVWLYNGGNSEIMYAMKVTVYINIYCAYPIICNAPRVKIHIPLKQTA